MTSLPADHILEKDIITAASRLSNWLLNIAFPRWYESGYDPETGVFFGSLDLESGTCSDATIRGRVPGRQIYCFSEAGKLGWDGPWETIVENGLSWYLEHCRLDDTSFANLVDIKGNHLDARFDLYNQAFALLAFAYAGRAIPKRSADLFADATGLLTLLRETHAHPKAGFFEDNQGSMPLQSNPHMHLFETALALEGFGAGAAWSRLADEIAGLAMTTFIDPVSGGLREFFDLEWAPMAGDLGRVMEPGHQFEWCWLLTRWGAKRSNSEAISKARRLYQIGASYGIDPERKVAIMALNDDFSVRDPLARLWGQTEWLKASVALARISVGVERTAYLAGILSAVAALERYFQDVPAGLWRDKYTEMHTFIQEPAPATSFYHIVCAIDELSNFANQLSN